MKNRNPILLLVGCLLSVSVLVQVPVVLPAFADTGCLTGFTLITNSQASAVDSQVPAIDNNRDGFVCTLTITGSDGTTTIMFTDNSQPMRLNGPPNPCPSHFAPAVWLTGTPPDRNQNGIVCINKADMLKGHVVIIDDPNNPQSMI